MSVCCACATKSHFYAQQRRTKTMTKSTKNSLPTPVERRGILAAWDKTHKKHVHFGRANDPAGLRKFAEWVATLTGTPSPDSTTGSVPADASPLNTTHRVQHKVSSVPTGATVADLSLAFLDAKREHSHYYHYRTACKFLKSYAKMETVDFDAFAGCSAFTDGRGGLMGRKPVLPSHKIPRS